jgi:hypothetical protein
MPPTSAADRDNAPRSTQPDVISPLISLALFGYYGFLDPMVRDTVDNETGETVALWLAFLWSMRAVAVLFLIALVMGIRRQPQSTLVSGAASLLCAVVLATFPIWDAIETRYLLSTPGWLLLLFAAWNGYVGITTLREGMAGLRDTSRA